MGEKYELLFCVGKSIGIISTTRITHATPAALYAHSPERDWESDVDMVDVTGGCVDIAKQLVEENFYIDVRIDRRLDVFTKGS